MCCTKMTLSTETQVSKSGHNKKKNGKDKWRICPKRKVMLSLYFTMCQRQKSVFWNKLIECRSENKKLLE